MFGDYLDKLLFPFILKLPKNHTSFQHLEFSDCGSFGLSRNSLEGILGVAYQGLFLKGFDQSEITSRALSIEVDSDLFIQCLNDATKLQVNAENKDSLEKYFEEEKTPFEHRKGILELFDLGKMSESEIHDKLITIRPYMTDIIDIWNDSPMRQFTLTSVGMAIGHANIKRLVGEFANLEIWFD